MTAVSDEQTNGHRPGAVRWVQPPAPHPDNDTALPPEDDSAPPEQEPGALLPAVRTDTAPAVVGRVVEPLPWERPAEVRPILPQWVVDRQQRRSALSWGAAWLWHETRFHGVRIPTVYSYRIVRYAPRGIWRAGAKLAYFVFDLEAQPLRDYAVARNDIATYMQLAGRRDHRVKPRLIGTAIGVGVVAALVWGLWFIAGWSALAALGAVVLVAAGVFGRRTTGQRFSDSALMVGKRRKLTPDMLVRAFLAVKLCTDGDPIMIARGPWRDGKGWLVVIELPLDKTASAVIKKREDLAGALRVDEVQLFLDRISGRDGGHAGMVELYLADTDPYAALPPVTPLADMDAVDMWEAFPFGVDARGREVCISLMWSSLLIGSIPRMGKTFAARIPLAACALDIYERIIAFDGKGGVDWRMFAAIAYRYGSGIRKVVVEHLLQVLVEAVEDMNRRYEQLNELPAHLVPEGKLTPILARNRRLNMPSTTIAIDEVHRYLEHDDHGTTIGDLLTELAKVGPAVGIKLILATQKPDSKAIPSKLRDALGTRFALKTMTWQASEAILGTGTSKAGINAKDFRRPHKGVGWLLGADDTETAEQEAQRVRSHFADGPVIQEICERARELRGEAGLLEGVATGEDHIQETPRATLLTDIHAVFRPGEKRLWSVLICERLAEADPAAYDGWDPTLLGNALRLHGIETRQVWMKVPEGENPNRNGLHLKDLEAALDEQL